MKLKFTDQTELAALMLSDMETLEGKQIMFSFTEIEYKTIFDLFSNPARTSQIEIIEEEKTVRLVCGYTKLLEIFTKPNEDRIDVLVAEEKLSAQVQTLQVQNIALKAQLQAQAQRNTLVEDCIAEMATIVYK